MKMLAAVVVVFTFCHIPVDAFSGIAINRHWKDAGCPRRLRPCCSSSPSSSAPSSPETLPIGEPYSTMTLLEHMHLLTPNVHNGSSGKGIKGLVDFFVNVLGFGLDPNSVCNVKKGSGVVFVNCGVSQLHLESVFRQEMEEVQGGMKLDSGGCFSEYEVGLCYNNLVSLKEGLSRSGLCSYTIINEGGDCETIRITDMHGRIFVARESRSQTKIDSTDEPTISSLCQRSVICTSDEDIIQYGADVVEKYGSTCEPLCRGIDYIEFFVPVLGDDDGNTIGKIATFYDFFFDAPTTVARDGTSHVAIVGFGKIGDDGRAEQSLLFRERLCDNPPAAGGFVDDADLGTGHRIAIYVGANDDDFEVAATNCAEGGLLWMNSNFEDRVLDVESAMKMKQFGFKDIIDVETGNVLYVLEHEVRSTSHRLFPRHVAV